MARVPAQDPESPAPSPYQCAVCGGTYVRVFDHVCVVTDACCHFGEMLIAEPPAKIAPDRVHVQPPPSPPPISG